MHVVELDGQYRAIREGCGLLDRGTAAALRVSGPEAFAHLQGQLTNDVEALSPGEGCYAALLDRKGRMQADMRVLALDPETALLLTGTETLGVVERHLTMYSVGREAEIGLPQPLRLISLLGPACEEIALGAPLRGEGTHRAQPVLSVDARVIATDAGVDVLVDEQLAAELIAALGAAGAEEITEAAAEIDRIERGRPRYGAEMDTATIPQEAGINERAVSFEKGCYIGQETVARLHYKGKPNRALRAISLDAPAAAGDRVMAGEREVGVIGSAAISPALGPIALALLRREAAPGDRVTVGEDNAGTVSDPPLR